MVKHHLVVFPSEAGLLVTSKRSLSGVGVVLVHPDPSGLDSSGHLIQLVGIASPYSCSKSVDGVVGDLYGLFSGLESGECHYRSEEESGKDRVDIYVNHFIRKDPQIPNSLVLASQGSH